MYYLLLLTVYNLSIMNGISSHAPDWRLFLAIRVLIGRAIVCNIEFQVGRI